MKNNTKNLYEPVEQKSYKKKYLERLEQDKDAKEEIRNYRPEKVSYPSNVEEKGTM